MANISIPHMGSAAVALAAASLSLPLLSCGGAPHVDPMPPSKDMAAMKKTVSELAEKVTNLEGRATLLEFRADQYRTVTVDPAGSGGFSRLDTSVGTFAIAVRNVTPFADGSRVQLWIGNLTAASVSQATIKAKWGKRMPKSMTEYLAWQQSLRETTVPLTETLKTGWWNKVVVTLPGSAPAELGYLELSMEAGQIALTQPRK